MDRAHDGAAWNVDLMKEHEPMKTKSEKSTKSTKSTWVSLILLAGMVLTTTAYIYALSGNDAYAVAVEQNRADRTALTELAKYDQLSALFRAVSKAVTPAVVEVRVTKKVAVPRGPNMDDFMRRFFDDGSPFHRGRPSQRRRGRPNDSRPKREYFSRGLGSGMIVDAANGYVLTNNHVVADADTVEVILHDKRQFKAQWVRRDGQTDLAVIKIKADNLIEAPLGDSDKMAVGDWVLAIGSPRGLQHTVTAGIISAKSRVTGQTSYENMLQTDAAINRGNSGGPLVNMKGEIIGINNSIATYSGGNEGIGFAIPANMARRIMTQLIENGKVVRGFLGVGIQDVTNKLLARSFKLPHTKGALITTVAKGTPAERAKLREQDFIVRIDGKDVASVNELRNVVANIKPGKTVEMVIYRGGERMPVKITIAPQPADMAGAFGVSPRGEKAARDRYGLKVQTLTGELAARGGYDESLKGVIITGVKPGSDAAEQGLRAGMVITQVMDKAVTTADEFVRALSGKNARSGVRLRVVNPGGGRRFVFITPVK